MSSGPLSPAIASQLLASSVALMCTTELEARPTYDARPSGGSAPIRKLLLADCW